MKLKVLFLYTEIAEYFLAGVQALVQTGANVHIVRWPINTEAPFNFRNIEGVTFYERNNFSPESLLELAKEISPQIIVSSGWVDKAYLKVCKHFWRKAHTVLALDNLWTGTAKQYLAKILSPFFLKKIFSHVWVPGNAQKKYALELGFDEKNIFEGFYSADTELFSNYYAEYFPSKEKSYPRKLLFVGRYIAQKGISDLWDAFIEIQSQEPNEWELICVGTGELYEKRKIHPKIQHLGFVQPSQMGEIIKQTGVFVLPSNFEPWGVVVHEYAAAGYPLLLTENVGAASAFLSDGENGFLLKSGNNNNFIPVLRKIMAMETNELIQMSKISAEKASRINPQNWARTINDILLSKI